MKTLMWQVKTKYSNQFEIVRRFRESELLMGSALKANIKFSQPAPAQMAVIRSHIVEGRRFFTIDVNEAGLEFEQNGNWLPLTNSEVETIPLLRFESSEFLIEDITEQRKCNVFEPEKWAEAAKVWDKESVALWHLRSGVMVESVIFRKEQIPVVLKSGYKLSYNPEKPDHLFVIEFDGIPQKIAVKQGRGENSKRACYHESVFIFTRVPAKSRIANMPLNRDLISNDSLFTKTMFAAGATWVLVMALMQMIPKTDPSIEVALEKLPDNIAKIILEPAKLRDGGNGREGGGGYEFATASDKRGGSGFESKRIAESSGREEVVLGQKGALAALSKAEKALAGGMLKALEAGGALATALGKLDEGLALGKVKMAGIPGSGGSGDGVGSARGSAKDVIGALNSNGAGGVAGGGLGIGGVGTKGFGGGGGGGGNGKGFGTGIGEGLGKGQGTRQLPFDSDQLHVRGGLERSEVEAVIQENISQIRLCYNRGLRSNPGLEGKVTSSFTIGQNGRVKLSRVGHSTLASVIVEDCIKDRIQSWKFPEPRGGGEVAVNYPFLLKSN